MRELRMSGSVRGVPSNGHPYRDRSRRTQAADWLRHAGGQGQEDVGGKRQGLSPTSRADTQELGAGSVAEVRRARSTIWPMTK